MVRVLCVPKILSALMRCGLQFLLAHGAMKCCLRVNVFREPLGRQLAAGSRFTSFLIKHCACRGELETESEIVNEASYF